MSEGGREGGGRARYFSIHISTVAFLVYFNLHPQKPFSCLKFESLNCSLRSAYRGLVRVSYMSVSVQPMYIRRDAHRHRAMGHGAKEKGRIWTGCPETLISHHSSSWNTLGDTEPGHL